MTAKRSVPRVPAGLGAQGKALWKAILGDLDADWELDARELHSLERACRCADEIARLEKAVDRDGPTVPGSRNQVVIHPALQEARQLRIVELRLLSSLELVDPVKAKAAASPASRRALKAAATRWSNEPGKRRMRAV